MDEREIENKLSAARTRLILDKPFLGALVLRLPLVAADPRWCPTTATDARRFYYNPDYVAELRPDETQFVLAHEALHCALSHFARRQHRVRQRWDVACDYAINPLLIEEGLTAPPGSLMMDEFVGMTAEEIYPYVQENEDETLDRHLYDDSDSEGEQGDGGPEPDREPQQGDGEGQAQPQMNESSQGEGGKPPPLSAAERESLSIQWQQRLAGAAQQAQQAGKLGGNMARLVGHLLQPQLPWRALLARYMSAVARDDYSYTRPSNRRGGPAVFPSMRSHQIELVIAVDVSGSITQSELGEFLAEIEALKGQMRARVTLHACDAELAPDGPWCYEPWEEFETPPRLRGGGGTRFTPVFDWVARQDRAPELLVYFTDAQGQFPANAPDYPVVWLVKGRTPVPWGERIQLN